MELVDTEGMRVIHAIVTTKSSGDGLTDGGDLVNNEYSGKDKLLENNYDLEVSVPSFDSGGSIDVIFYKNFADELCKGFCIISILDANGNHRFPKTFLFVNESDRRVSYISESTLRSDSDVLIPNNILTLLIDVYFIEHPKSKNSIELEYDDAFATSFEYSSFTKNRLLMDSPLAKCLLEESEFLKRSIIKRKWETLYFDEKNFITFKHIGKILMEINPLRFNSIKEIFEMYIIAGRYDIPAVTATCKCFLKLCLFDYTAEEYLALADEYEVLKNEINQVNETDFNEEIETYADGVRLKLPIRNCLWFYRHPQKNDLLYFENIMAPFKKCILIEKEEKDEVFDFYT